MNNRQKGKRYEQLASDYLRDEGYKILEQNYRNKQGEIDVIASKDNTLVYCEIKYRSGVNYGHPLEAVDIKKQRQICKVASYHYARYGWNNMACRFDVIGIEQNGKITHIMNAFDYIR